MATVRLTMAQALVRYLVAQRVSTESGTEPLFGGVWAIFGHGNVVGLGEALYAARKQIPTYRAHNEQGMALAATASGDEAAAVVPLPPVEQDFFSRIRLAALGDGE